MPHIAPKELKVNAKDVKRLAKRRALKPGWYRFLTGGSKQDVSKNKGTIAIAQTYYPLTDPKDPKSKGTPTIRNSLWMPFANENVPGHKAPNTVGLCHSTFLAFEPDSLPEYPVKEDGKLMFKGEEITPEEEEEAREEVTEATLNMCAEKYEDPASLDGYMVYGEVFENGGFMNVRNVRAELPEDAELVPPEQWVDGDDEEEAESEPPRTAQNGKSNGRNSAPAAKKRKR